SRDDQPWPAIVGARSAAIDSCRHLESTCPRRTKNLPSALVSSEQLIAEK
ncbi:hypothetical protein PanWU01x14_111650, partial [Parasponia andersonii]